MRSVFIDHNINTNIARTFLILISVAISNRPPLSVIYSCMTDVPYFKFLTKYLMYLYLLHQTAPSSSFSISGISHFLKKMKARNLAFVICSENVMLIYDSVLPVKHRKLLSLFFEFFFDLHLRQFGKALFICYLRQA